MMKILVPLLAAITIFAVGFVLVELRAPVAPATSPPPPPTPVAAPLPPPRPTPSPKLPTPNAQPTPPSTGDPLEVVVRGKTRREWHIYYAERQKQTAIEILRYQTIVDRAVAGEEPDPRDLTDAHDRIRELNLRLKDDLEALQQIDGTP
jgi:hypothetical protein